MKRALVIAVLATMSSGCTGTEGRDAKFEEALSGTRHDSDPAHANSAALPLSDLTPHHLRMSGTFVLRKVGAGSGRAIEVTRNLYRGKSNAFRLEEMRFWTDPVVAPEGRQDGRQAVFNGESLAVRRSWGPWMKRENVGGQHEALLRSAHDIAPAVMEAFSPYMVFRPDPEGDATIAGVAVRWERVGLDLAVQPRPLKADALKALREHEDDWKTWLAASHKPIEISGRIARRIDGDKDLVSGNLSIKGIGTWSDERRDFMLLLNYEIAPLPPHVSFEVSDEILPARRERPWRMVKDVLGDELLSPYQR